MSQGVWYKSLDFKFSGKSLEGFKQRSDVQPYLLRKIILTPIWKIDCSVARVSIIRSVGRLLMLFK